MQEEGFEKLRRDVIEPGLCTRCGGCVASCPVDVLEYGPERIRLKGECINCGTCLRICPGHGVDFSSLEKDIFGRCRRSKYGTIYGIHRKRMNLVASDREIFRRGYTGGRVTAVLINALDRGMIDGAMVTDWGDGGHLSVGSARIARNRNEVLESASSKYLFSPLLTLLKEVRDDTTLKRVALVGLPCHMEAFRKMERDPVARELTHKIRYLIGLNCGAPNMDEGSWRKAVERLTGVKGDEITEFKNWKIKSDVLRFHVESGDGSSMETDVSLWRYIKVIYDLPTWSRCEMCPDYSGELSDITFGGPTVRTERGEDLVGSALANGMLKRGKMKNSLTRIIGDIIIYLRKIRRTKKTIKERGKECLPIPDFK